ncbi:MAG: RNA polymerase sigma factor [Acidobacteriia bacterium]|nr:RNA polymerase sigma factor [Terriglobia bacterium]
MGAHDVDVFGKVSNRMTVELSNAAMKWEDAQLVRQCLAGNEEAWTALIDKYKNLIYSIAIKYHAAPEDAADIFQAVCLDLYSELPRLRKTESFRSWLITMATHKAFHWKLKQRRQTTREVSDGDETELGDEPAVSPQLMEDVEREQIVREAVASLSERCRQLIQLLFYEHPPMPYRDVAQKLGLATGSLGFIRGRCLSRLQKALGERGFEE